MRVFIISLDKKVCDEFGLVFRDTTTLLSTINVTNHYAEVFDAIYSKTLGNGGLHPLAKKHLHSYFITQNVKDMGVKTNLISDISKFYYALKYHAKFMSLGELGCYASHYLLWKKCIELNEPICILEDDITLKENFKESLDFLQKHIQELGYVRLMYLLYDSSVRSEFLISENQEIQKYIEVINAYSYGVGTQGYVITPKVARVFLRYSQKWVIPVDTLMDATFMHGVRNLVLKSFAIADDNQISTISRTEEPYSPKIALMRECHFKYLKWWRFL
ncbi:glycosyltransferase family 25 protein [Helicobacter cetorum]|uniref:Lipopolysaccharide biosynthesis protein n=1 Tax=Helicobacter cetorum (strain ATCC BAA-540 / CCUG 52418 / MIT 99-5656) TaxID=1163745 RepID=I0ET81_HELCM|nr:glycosyltransferase family 25 protein [Helicobacter cetorum]AFI06150.1 lipopolysaccharide biosynthesis protein [Helicobacter cetorum MIT 99-5656]